MVSLCWDLRATQVSDSTSPNQENSEDDKKRGRSTDSEVSQVGSSQ